MEIRRQTTVLYWKKNTNKKNKQGENKVSFEEVFPEQGANKVFARSCPFFHLVPSLVLGQFPEQGREQGLKQGRHKVWNNVFSPETRLAQGLTQGLKQGRNKVKNKVGTMSQKQGQPCSEQGFFSVEYSIVIS